MEIKKIVPIMIVLTMLMAFIIVTPVSAATSRVAIYNSNSDEVTSFSSNSNMECLEIYAILYVDGEWRAWRYLDFDIYDHKGNHLFHVERLTSFITGYAGIGIWNNELSKWETGNYTVKVSYGGKKDYYRRGEDWPATSTTAIIHHINNNNLHLF